MSEELPPEVLRLAISGAEPSWAERVEHDARQLTAIAKASALHGWTPLEEVYSKDMLRRGRSRLEGAQLNHEAQYDGPILAVAKTPIVTGRVARRIAWYSVVDGLPLRHRGQIVLFATVKRAQKAAALAAAFLAWHRIFSLALPAAQQAGELMKLSDAGEPYFTPRRLAIRKTLGMDDGLIMRGLVEGRVDTNSPLRLLAAATGRLFGALVVAQDEYDTPPSLTFNSADYLGVDLAAAKSVIEGALARLDEMHDSDFERERREEFEELCAAVERGVALPGNQHG
jgi:hypothetical protein